MKTKHRYYTPQLDRQLISVLYREAKARKIPMTKLANELIWRSLERKDSEFEMRIADLEKAEIRKLKIRSQKAAGGTDAFTACQGNERALLDQ